MNLSELVAYRTLLDEYRPADSHLRVFQTLDPLCHVITSHDIEYPDLLAKLSECRGAINSDLDRFESTIDEIRQRVQEEINSLEHSYLAASYKLYDDEMCHDSVEHILNRRPNLTEEAESYLTGRIRLRADWKRAGMIIRPGLETWIQDLVALDPLYLVDHKHGLLDPAMQRFNTKYQNRLRPYIIQEDSDDMLAMLPDEQIGFCLAYNFFNYKPFEVVRNYLEEIYQKLAPGGVLAMTINDCDRAGGVQLAERHFMCYTPGGMVKNLARSLGYVVQTVYEVDSACTWIEFAKSGYRPSLRGGQALAQIYPKGVPAMEFEQPMSEVMLFEDEVKPVPVKTVEPVVEPPVISEREKRVNANKDLINLAHDLNIPSPEEMSADELRTKTSDVMMEFKRLRLMAMRLKIARDDVILSYNLKELKTAIKQWRKSNERPLT